MKALIRHEGETILETDGIEGIEWKTGAPLTNKTWAAGLIHLLRIMPLPNLLTSKYGKQIN